MYQRKISGPIMDRMDMQIQVPAIKYDKLALQAEHNENSKIRERVIKARNVQSERFKTAGILTNSEMSILEIKKHCAYDAKSQALLKKCVDTGRLSVRGYHRVLKVARTIADLAQSKSLAFEHIAEALMYRTKQ
jgi:magnesium chelatase family protein